jgi:hypothetical protein
MLKAVSSASCLPYDNPHEGCATTDKPIRRYRGDYLSASCMGLEILETR